MYVITIEETFNYGRGRTLRSVDTFEKASEWVKKEYPDAVYDEYDDCYTDSEADVKIYIDTAAHIL